MDGLLENVMGNRNNDRSESECEEKLNDRDGEMKQVELKLSVRAESGSQDSVQAGCQR